MQDSIVNVSVFFFQAEDGIRDTSVTGVQTCALPICDLAALVKLQQQSMDEETDIDDRFMQQLIDMRNVDRKSDV